MPDKLNAFQPILSDTMLAQLDAKIQTMDPARAEAAYQGCLQAAKDARSAKEFLSIVTKLIGTAVAFI